MLYTAWTYSQLYGQAANYQSYSNKYSLAQDLIATIRQRRGQRLGGDRHQPGTEEPQPGQPADMAILISYVDDRLRIIRKPEFSGDSSFAEESFQKIGGILRSATGARSNRQTARAST